MVLEPAGGGGDCPVRCRQCLCHVVFPLYFVDGVAEAYDEYFAPPDTLHAKLYWEGGGLQGEFYDPPPEYGDYEYIEIRWSDDYIRVDVNFPDN